MKGIDGTRNGWIAVKYTRNTWDIEFFEELSDIDFYEALIDIPIGLPEESMRKCDEKARVFLAPERHYSIFNCPVREAVYAESMKRPVTSTRQRLVSGSQNRHEILSRRSGRQMKKLGIGI